jgi:4-amino-4-deoxy-L-arabinose transferase-like glycosyltransferase
MNRLVLVIAACLAVLAYVWGLGGLYIPSNGDEMVYAHIARKTAESGHWLPLASDLFETRNTKPPMLFWQAMVAGDVLGWSLTAMRAPGVLYTFATAAMLACLVARALRNTPAHHTPWATGLLAAVVFLAFFSTLRYHRAYLTSAPETFWFSLPILMWFWQLSQSPSRSSAIFSIANNANHQATSSSTSSSTSRSVVTHQAITPSWLSVVLLGLGLGVGLAYKSFALVAPAAAAWWLVVVASQPWMGWRALLLLSLKIALAAALALAVFGLWFVLDPDPASVWQEFIVAENAKKFSDQRGYWAEALSLNGSSIWSQLLAYAVNAGLLAPVVLGLMAIGVRHVFKPEHSFLQRIKAMNPLVALALAWLLVWLLTFTIPSQRSARYVIPAMPAVAILIALYWQRVHAHWFRASALLSLVAAVLLARVAWVMSSFQGGLGISRDWEATLALALALGVGLCAIASLHARAGRMAALLSVLGVYVLMDAVLMPMNGEKAQFNNTPINVSTAAVPNNFNGQYERYRYILPAGQEPQPYDVGARAAQGKAGLDELLSKHDSVVWAQAADLTSPECAPACHVLGVRWVLKSRHLKGEVRLDNLWTPQDWLFAREWWLQSR